MTKKQERFAREMANPETKSKTDAARKAGYANPRQEATRLLANDYIYQKTEQNKRKHAKKAGIREQHVLGGTVEMAYADIDDFVDKKGKFSWETARKNGVTHLIKEITYDTKGNVKTIKLADSQKAFDRLGDYLGMKQKDRENMTTIEIVAKEVRAYLSKFPNARYEDVVEVYAKHAGLDEDLLGEAVGDRDEWAEVIEPNGI